MNLLEYKQKVEEIINGNIITNEQIIVETVEHKFARGFLNDTLERIKRDIDKIKTG